MVGADPRRWAPRARQASRRCSAAARPGGCGTPVLRTTLTCLPAARSPSISSTVPEGATPVRVPSRLANIATLKSARENLGLGGRRVLVSRQWSGKTLSEHRADRATVVREALTSPGSAHPNWTRWQPRSRCPTGHPGSCGPTPNPAPTSTPASSSPLVTAGCNVREVSEWAGHNSVAFTLTRYGGLFEDSSAEAVDRLDALLSGR